MNNFALILIVAGDDDDGLRSWTVVKLCLVAETRNCVCIIYMKLYSVPYPKVYRFIDWLLTEVQRLIGNVKK